MSKFLVAIFLRKCLYNFNCINNSNPTALESLNDVDRQIHSNSTLPVNLTKQHINPQKLSKDNLIISRDVQLAKIQKKFDSIDSNRKQKTINIYQLQPKKCITNNSYLSNHTHHSIHSSSGHSQDALELKGQIHKSIELYVRQII